MSQILNIGRSLQSDYSEWLSACAESGLEVYAGAFVASDHAMTALVAEDIVHMLAAEQRLNHFFGSVLLPDPSEALASATAVYPEQQKTATENDQSRQASGSDSSGKDGTEMFFLEKQPLGAKHGEGEQEPPQATTTAHRSPFVSGPTQTPAIWPNGFENNRFSPEIQTSRSKQDEENDATGSGSTTKQKPPAAANQLAAQSPAHLPNGLFSNNDWGGEASGKQKTVPETAYPNTVAKNTGLLPQNEPSNAFSPAKLEDDFAPLKRLSHFADRFSGWVSTDPLPVLNPVPVDHQNNTDFVSSDILSGLKATYQESATEATPPKANIFYPDQPPLNVRAGTPGLAFPLAETAQVHTPETGHKTTESQHPENHAVSNPDVDDLIELFARRMEQAFHRFYG